MEIARLTASLIAKNTTIKEKNSTLFRLERLTGSLQADLVAERNKNGSSSVVRMGGSASASSKATNTAQRKRRHAYTKAKGGDEENRWVVE
jgi:hypothetical protein